MGCGGCELWTGEDQHCYAATLSRRYAGMKGWPRRFDRPEMFPGRLAKAAKWRDLKGQRREMKPWLDGLKRVIFVGDMGDLFCSSIPFEYLRDEVLAPMVQAPGWTHLWLLLTKRLDALVRFQAWLKDEHSPWPGNAWTGVSVTGPSTLWRLDWLNKVYAPVRFLSLEPLLGPVSRLSVHWWHLDWVIVGCESGDNRRSCDQGWVEDVVATCRDGGVPVFVKQLAIGGEVVQDWTLFPPHLRIREMPTIARVNVS